jgi:hypothetical protein
VDDSAQQMGVGMLGDEPIDEAESEVRKTSGNLHKFE